MSPETPPKPQLGEEDPDRVTRAGGWLFKHRTTIPLPIAIGLLVIPARPSASQSTAFSTLLPALGVLLVVAGEAIRLWGVHHIGVISRTRSDRLGPLVDSGPFGIVRNPLYVGNILLWLGFAIGARLAWLTPLVFLVLALEYHAIVRWEERLLASRIGASYRSYLDRVPRWLPRPGTPTPDTAIHSHLSPAFSWRQTLYSERGTLIAIVVGYALLAMKTQILH